MIVWFTSGQSLTACLQPILLFAAPFLVAIVALSLFLSPWAELRKIEFERQLESRDDIAFVTPGLFREFSRANLVVFVESINPLNSTVQNVFLHSVEDKQDATTVAARGKLEDNAQRRPLHRARARPPLPGHAGDRRLPRCRVRAARPAHRAQRGPGVADLDQGNSDRRAGRFRWPDRARRAVLAHLGADFRADAHAAGRAARLRQPTHGTLVQPRCRGIPVHALQQLPQHRAEPDRAGKARAVGRPAAAARDRASRRRGALPPAVVGERALPARGADQRPPDDPMRSSPLPRTLRR